MGASAWDQSTTAASNSDIGGVNQAEGCAPSTVNNATRALAAQMKGALIGVTASGTDTYTATLAPAPDALTDGMTVHIRFTNANATTTPTLNINSLGATTIVKEGSAALVAGDIPAGHEGELRYNGTNWVLLNPKVNGAALTGSANTFTADQTVQSADAGATAGPVLTLDRNSASPASSDIIGNIVFKGRDGGGNVATYADIYANIQDTTDTTEDGALVFRTAQAGTVTIAGYFQTGLVVGAPTGSDKGLGTVNATALYQNGTAVSDGLAKAVAVFNGTSANPITPLYSKGVSGTITKNGTGDYTITWSAAFSSTDYAIFTNGQRTTVSDNINITLTTIAAGSVRIVTRNGSGTAEDYPHIFVMALGA